MNKWYKRKVHSVKTYTDRNRRSQVNESAAHVPYRFWVKYQGKVLGVQQICPETSERLNMAIQAKAIATVDIPKTVLPNELVWKKDDNFGTSLASWEYILVS